MTKLRIPALLALAFLMLPHGMTQAAERDTWKGRAFDDYCKVYPKQKLLLLVVDASAPYSPADVARLSRGLRVLKEEHTMDTPGFRLEVKSVGSVVEQSQDLFSACIPACPTDLGPMNECIKPIVRRDREEFWKKLESVLSTKLSAGEKPPGSETALAETIEWVTRNRRPAELVIFSDFLEFHAQGGGLPRVTFYSPTEGGLASYMKDLAAKNYLPNLSSTKVVGFGFGQELGGSSNFTKKSGGLTPGQWQVINKFWTRYLQEAGASGFSLSKEYPGAAPPAEAPPPPPEPRRAGL